MTIKRSHCVYRSNETSPSTCLQPSGVMVEKIEIDQVLKPSREKKGGCHWSPDLKHTRDIHYQQNMFEAVFTQWLRLSKPSLKLVNSPVE